MPPTDFELLRQQLMRRLQAGEIDQAAFDRRMAEAGLTLADFRERYLEKHGRIPYFVAARILKPVAEDLDAAHAKNVVHGWLGSEKIRVQPDGFNAQVVDFGSADGREATRQGAPEQRKGERVDGKADQFALGAIVFELLTGRPLASTSSASRSGAENSRKTAVPDEPCPRLPDQPDCVQRALARALASQPSQRFDSCRQFLEALSADVPVPPPIPNGRKSSASRDFSVAATSAITALQEAVGGKWRMIGGMALALMVVLGLVYVFSRGDGRAPEASGPGTSEPGKGHAESPTGTEGPPPKLIRLAVTETSLGVIPDTLWRGRLLSVPTGPGRPTSSRRLAGKTSSSMGSRNQHFRLSFQRRCGSAPTASGSGTPSG